MLHLNIQGLRDESGWQAAHIALPRYDVSAMQERTLAHPTWIHFGAGNIFRGHIQDALFNMVGIWTSQGIQLLGMPTEAIHTPFMSDRYLSIENARYIFNNMKNIGDEVEFKEGGLIRKRAKEVLDKATALLERLEKEGLFSALEKGIFADIKRPMNGGKGLEGVSSKGRNYYNPFVEIMKNGSRAAAKK